MPYTALYREKRPQLFNEVIGQPHIIRTLKNQLTTHNVSHAYLFCGTRGTGKTSTAKIFSRAVNCQTPQGGEPCNECEVCKDILTERNLGVVEIDAASNNGVENIRDLREEVKYPPTEGNYKVFIIDEVHMLSTSAFNALLKTLEEPPPHVIFILATTDPQKIPATILSRCQRYDFKRITMTDMVTTIKKYLQDEKMEDEALRYIASLSDGAMRDALSIVDQCLSFYSGETVTLDKARELLGAVDKQVLFDFTDGLAASDAGKVLTLVHGIISDGRDVGHFIADLIRHFRDLLVASQTEGLDLLEYIEETQQAFKSQSNRIPIDDLILYIYTFSELQRDLRFAPHARTALEVCVIKLCKSIDREILIKKQHIQDKISPSVEIKADNKKEPTPLSEVIPVKNQPSGADSNNPDSYAPDSNNPDSYAPGSLIAVEKGWGAFCMELPMPLRSWLSQTGIDVKSGRIQILCSNEANLSLLKNKQKDISEKISTKFALNSSPNLAFVVRDAYNKPVVPEVKEKTQTPVVPSANDDGWGALGEQVEMENEW